MVKVFLVSGLGADTRLYNKVELDEYDVTPVDWLEPNRIDTLITYAQKLIHQYHITNKDVVIGVSLGGMLAVEIAKQVKLNKVILISSIKTVSEAPWYFALFRKVPVYKIIPKDLYNSLGVLIELFFGKMDPADLWLFKDMLKKSSPNFLRWAMEAVLKWDNHAIPTNLYQIIGDKDLVFDYKRIKNPTSVVKGGTHIMVYDKAKQINKLLKTILRKK